MYNNQNGNNKKSNLDERHLSWPTNAAEPPKIPAKHPSYSSKRAATAATRSSPPEHAPTTSEYDPSTPTHKYAAAPSH